MISRVMTCVTRIRACWAGLMGEFRTALAGLRTAVASRQANVQLPRDPALQLSESR
jgi:hypothetical protein